MAIDRNQVAIVGCGPGSPQYLTDAARHAAAEAEVLFGSRRLLAMFADSAAEKIPVDAHIAAAIEQVEALADTGRSVAVLVSGDPGLYSLAQRVTDRLGRQRCRVIPGVSSVQVAFARLGLDWIDARILSAHGREPQIAPDELCRWDKLAILAGTREGLHWAAKAAAALDVTHAAVLCENLTLDGERIRQMTPEQLESADAASLAIVLLLRRSLIE